MLTGTHVPYLCALFLTKIVYLGHYWLHGQAIARGTTIASKRLPIDL